jgi:phosphatidylserine decarboxylase
MIDPHGHPSPQARGGRLKWRALSAGQAHTFGQQGTASPLPQAPGFLKDLPAADEAYEPREPITRTLKTLIDRHAYTEAFSSALARVSQQRIPELDRIHSLDQFYFYLDALATWIPELRIWQWEGGIYHERTDYLRITQFYYYFNQPELVALQSPIAPIGGEALTPLSLWLRQFAIAWGEFLDTPASARQLESYKFAPEYAYQDYEGGEDGIGQYKSFNQWFSRTFKDIEALRPVAQPEEPRIIVFPAESTFVGQWTISTAVGEPLPAESSIVVKHVEWPIPELLKDSPYARDFEGGILVHSFLNIFDYHRQHAPAAGQILEARFIPGQVYLEVVLDLLDAEQRAEEGSSLANAVIPSRYLEAQDPTGYQFVQCRGLFVLQTAIGKIAVLPMGMAQVSSVVFVKPGTQELIRLSPEEQQGRSYDEQVALINARVAAELVGRRVAKGEMISSFLFGGSDIVMLFERQSNVNITAIAGVHYPVRSQYAVSNIATLLA